MTSQANLLHPRDALMQMMDRIYRYRMTTTSGGNLSIRDANGDVWVTPARSTRAACGATILFASGQTALRKASPSVV